MPRVVVAAALGLAGAHRQQRLGSVERLDLALLVDTQHEGAVGRRHVEPDDVANLVHEQRVGRELEALGAMRLQAEGLPNPMDRRRRIAGRSGHAAQRPMRRVGRRLLQRPADRLGNRLVADPPWRARARLVVQPVEPMLGKPPTPFADGGRIRPELSRDLLVLKPGGRRQDDLCPARQPLSGPTPTAQTLQRLALRLRQISPSYS